MKSIKRITPDMVIEAYNKTGLKPIQEEWYGYDIKDGKRCACGLGAVAIANGAANMGSLEVFVRKKMGLNYFYVNGYTVGFDHGGTPSKHMSHSEGWLAGFEDGNAARKRLIALGDFEGGEDE